jgi:GDP-L-fucose synthase
MDKHSKIYVAGHNGLVGSAILARLREKGYDNFVYREFSSLDLRDQQQTRDFFESERPDYVFLAAAKVGGIVANNTYRGEFIYDNLMIQNNIIHNAWSVGVKKLLFLGSTCIYPKEAPQPMTEDLLLTSPLEYTNEPYAIAKIAGIKLCESYNLQYDTNFISVMPTNLYGPNDNFDLEKSHVLPALIRKLILGSYLENNNWQAIRHDLGLRPIEGVNGDAETEQILQILRKYGIISPSGETRGAVEIWGTGKPLREFMWSADLSDACVFIMENVDFKDVAGDHKEVRNTHINIGTGEEISIEGLANKIKMLIGFKGNLIFNTSKPDGTMRKTIDVTKLHRLGWRHQVGLEEGLKRIVEWYRNK